MDREKISAVVSRFPETFGLRAFAGKTFRIADWPSTFEDAGIVHLVVQVEREGKWLDFGRTTEGELRREVCAL